MDISKGYLRLFRKIEDWEWYDKPNTKAIFLHCLINANEKDKIWQGKKIKRGQFVTSLEKLANANGLTIQQTRTALSNIEKSGDINKQTTNQYTVITVKNYNLYQPINKQKHTPFQQTNNMQLNKQITTTNNNIDISNILYSSSSIEEIKLTEEEEELLKKFSKRVDRKIKNYRLWRKKVIQSGDYLDILREEKEKQAKLELQRLHSVENIPPPEIEQEDVKEIEQARQKARAKVLQGLKGDITEAKASGNNK